MSSNNREYTNGEITVYWKPDLCVHATTCFRELKSVFDPSKRPWVNMKGGSTSEIVRVCDLCPTDALTYTYNDKTAQEQNLTEERKEEKKDEVPTTIRVMPNGPLVVRGEFQILGEDGKELKKMKIVSFCRCGFSLNMPYCDGAHRKNGWVSR